MENLVISLIQAALQPYLQQFFNILIEIRDRLPASAGVNLILPVSQTSAGEPSIPAFVYEVPKEAIPVTPVVQPEPKEITRQEIGELATKVAITVGVAKASEIILPFQITAEVEGERYPNMNNIAHTPANYAVLAAAFNAALAAAK